jgi:hypothetical protein
VEKKLTVELLNSKNGTNTSTSITLSPKWHNRYRGNMNSTTHPPNRATAARSWAAADKSATTLNTRLGLLPVQQFNSSTPSVSLTTALINRKGETNTTTPTCPPLANVFFPSLPSTVGPPSPFPPLPRNTWSQYLPFPIRPCTKGLVLDQTRH